MLPLHIVDGRRRGFVVDRLHALLGERTGVFDRLFANLAERGSTLVLSSVALHFRTPRGPNFAR